MTTLKDRIRASVLRRVGRIYEQDTTPPPLFKTMCPECDGFGWNKTNSEAKCPVCDGEGFQVTK